MISNKTVSLSLSIKLLFINYDKYKKEMILLLSRQKYNKLFP